MRYQPPKIAGAVWICGWESDGRCHLLASRDLSDIEVVEHQNRIEDWWMSSSYSIPVQTHWRTRISAYSDTLVLVDGATWAEAWAGLIKLWGPPEGWRPKGEEPQLEQPRPGLRAPIALPAAPAD